MTLSTLLLVPLDDNVVFPNMNVTIAADVADEERVLLVPRHEGEYAKVGTVVGTLSAKDPEGGAVSYSLSSNPGGIFKIVDNKLQLAKAVDYETAKLHAVTVVATSMSLMR